MISLDDLGEKIKAVMKWGVDGKMTGQERCRVLLCHPFYSSARYGVDLELLMICF